MPRGFINPATCEGNPDSRTSVAAVGTIILEFARLSDITNDNKYVKLARKAEKYLLSPKPSPGEPYPELLGSFVSMKSGEIMDSSGSWGAMADCKQPSCSIRSHPDRGGSDIYLS